ncbi:hypothetical protein ACHAXS_005480 [Conticribra weissflogii]
MAKSLETVEDRQPEQLKSWQLFARLQRRLHRRAIRIREAKLQKRIEDDATAGSHVSLPKTLKEALPEDIEIRSKDERAIMVTEVGGRFDIIGCNKAWENLCGYAECEVVGKNSTALQGPETNYDGLREAVARLFEGEDEVKVITTNYRKDGSKFKNFLTMGPLRDENGKLTHFVAVLNNIGARTSW